MPASAIIHYGLYHFDEFNGKWRPCRYDYLDYDDCAKGLCYSRSFEDCDHYATLERAQQEIDSWVMYGRHEASEFKIVAKKYVAKEMAGITFGGRWVSVK